MTRSRRKTMTTAEVRELLVTNPRARLIDVRDPGEFAAAHIPGSYNVPLNLLQEHGTESRAEHGDPVVLVCRSGMRAGQAHSVLDGAGLNDVSVLDGGLRGW